MSDLTNKNGSDDTLAAEYVLGLLTHPQRLSFSDHLKNEVELQEKVSFWENHFAVFNDAFEEITPPAHLYRKIEETLFTANDGQNSIGFMAQLWNHTGIWRSLSAVAGLAMLVLIAQNVSLIQKLDERTATTSYIAQLAGEGATYKIATLYKPESGLLKISYKYNAVKTDRSLELWLIEADRAPVSLGLLPVKPKGELVINPKFREKILSGLLAVTDEPIGGGPDGKPTGPVVASGKLIAL